ncbi:hypothetical protein SAMN04487934_10678 [Eubacterium ruminantium]|nr:hypothetical protein SAMN04487934_10678 [Eubacterium ruminantium]
MKEVDNEIEEVKGTGSEVVEIEMPAPDDFAGTPEERTIFGQQVIAGFNNQKTLLDKVYYYISYYTYKSLMETSLDREFPDGKVIIPPGTDPEKRQKMINDVQTRVNNLVNMRERIGLSRTNNTSPEDEQTFEVMQKLFISSLIGDGSRKALLEGMKMISLISEYHIYKGGMDYNDTLNKMAPDVKNKEKKALGINYYDPYNINTLYAGAIGDLRFNLNGSIASLSEADPDGIADQIFEALHFNKYMKVSTFMNKIGFNADEQKRFLDIKGFNKDETVYEAYKRKLTADNNGQAVSEEDILAEIKYDYIHDLTTGVIQDISGQPYNYFNDKYYDGMTMDYYMNILGMNSDEKELFISENSRRFAGDEVKPDFIDEKGNIKRDATVKDVFKALFYKDEAYLKDTKKKKIDAELFNKFGKGYVVKPEDYITYDNLAVITEDDYKTYAKDIVQRETDRFKFKGYKGRNNATIEKFLCTAGYSKSERQEYYTANNVQASDKAKDVLKAQYIKEKKLNPEDAAKVTDDTVFNYATDFMESERERFKKSGRKRAAYNVGFQVRDELMDSMKTDFDKGTFKAGINIFAGENFDGKNLKPEPNATKPDDIDYNDWLENEIKTKLVPNEEKNLSGHVKSFKKILTSGKQLNFGNDKTIQKYYDTNVVTTNPVFIRGAISQLNATKKGSANTAKYDNMMDALKEYELKLISSEQEGVLAAKNKVIEMCKAYIKGRKSKRSSEAGNKRFEVASTVLYTLMPRDEFRTWANDVNSHRSGEYLLTYPRCAERQLKYYTEQEKIEEDAQENTKYDKTFMSQEYSSELRKFEKFVGMNPEFDDKYAKLINKNEHAAKFTAIPKDVRISPIGSSAIRRGISEKDFAALVYSGVYTQEALQADPRLKDHPDTKGLYTGKDYTTELVKNPPSAESGKYLDVLVKGREAAINALNDYSIGSKYLLAHLVATGIRYAAAAGRSMTKLDDSLYMNSEMGRRLIDMIDRDNELKHIISLFGIENMDKDIEYVKSMNTLSEVYQKSTAASKYIDNIDNMIKEAPEASHEIKSSMKEELVTDVLMTKLIEDCNTKYKEANRNRTKYKNEIKPAYEKYRKETGKLPQLDPNILDDKGNVREGTLSPEEYQKRRNELEDEYKHAVKLADDHVRDNPLMDSLSDKKSTDLLRESVRKIVKDSGIAKKSIREIKAELNKPKIVNKVAALATQTREQKNEAAAEAARKAREAARKAREAARKAREAARKKTVNKAPKAPGMN